MKASSIFPEYILGHPKGQEQAPNLILKPKDPKSRPPGSVRDKIPLYGKLPKYSGPYEVGVIDLEIPAQKPRTFSEIKRQHVHILSLETILLSIYYPAHYDCANDVRIAKAKKEHNARPTWLSRPRGLTARGYGRFAGLPEWPTMAFFFMTCWLTKLPAYRNARLADHWLQIDAPWKNRKDGRAARGTPPERGLAQPKFPLLIFSHGLGGTRTCYSSICGEFASNGFIVVAVEHRDGSGPRTLVSHAAEGYGSRAEREESGGIDHLPLHYQHPWEMVDFIFPINDKNDVAPGHQIDFELREAQIDMRVAELHEAYQIMESIAAGRANEEIVPKNLRHKGTHGASSQGLIGVDFDDWKDRFHTDNITIVGHSFGSATTIEMLRRGHDFPYLQQGIIYDVWGMPVRHGTLEHHINKPLLGINSEAFMYWDANFEIAKDVCREVRSAGQQSWLMTVRGTVHVSQSDFCIVYPHIASTVMKMTMNPIRAIDVNIDASIDFLSRVMKFDEMTEQSFMRNPPSKKLLDVPCMPEVPTEHRPKEKWMAIRLKISHEGRKRLRPHAKQHYWERLLKELGQEEVWVHLAPGCEDRLDSDEDLAEQQEQDNSAGSHANVEIQDTAA